jgi:diguanylate cyclase (GGDEF)-like protein/PAS domain S-box-containing protein
MLAYDSGIATAYDLGLTTLSLVIATFVTFAGLGFAATSKKTWAPAVSGGIVGGGIAMMHYTGMWALQIPGNITWSPDLVLTSITLGALFGMAALEIAVRRNDTIGKMLAALMLTLAIVSHHFTAMGAVHITPDSTRVAGMMLLSPTSLAIAVASSAVAILGMSLIGVSADHRLAMRSHAFGQELHQLTRDSQKLIDQSRDRLREKSDLLDAAVKNMSQGLVMFDASTRLLVCNDRYLELYDLKRDDVKPGWTMRDIVMHRAKIGTLPGDPDVYLRGILDAVARGETRDLILETGDGRTISVIHQPMPEGGWVATHEDITERRKAEKELDRTRAFLDTIVENVPATLLVKDSREHRYVLVNKAAENFLGIRREEIIGKNAHDLFPPDQANNINKHDTEVLMSGRQMFIELAKLETPRNGTRLISSKRLSIGGENGEPKYLINVVEDLTERKRAEERAEHLARYDLLTDLPNRAAFGEKLVRVLDDSKASANSFAILCLDIDRFKDINDVFGPSVADGLLREVSRRLHEAAGANFIARVGGDEFYVIIESGQQPATAALVAEHLLACSADEFVVEGQQLRMGLSIGVAIYPMDGTDTSTLLGNADAALHRAKAESRGSFCFFEADMDTQLRERRALQQDLQAAIAHNQFTLNYQPQARIGGEIVGFEALVRWHHPSRGSVPPGFFIPLAEESGLIVSLGEWILREACRKATIWPEHLHIAVNLSPVQFRHGDLPSLIHTILLETGLSPNRLELEVTEGVLIDDFSRGVSLLRRLKALGVRIALDDFGTGYSSLSYLQSFPFDKIKIDQTFISNVERNPQSAAIVRGVIGLARGLNLPVLAEGVETREQLAFLSKESCDEVQGYYVGRPAPIENYSDLIKRPKQPFTKSASAG